MSKLDGWGMHFTEGKSVEETDLGKNEKCCFGHVKFEWVLSHPGKGNQEVAIKNKNQGLVVSEKPRKECISKDRNDQLCQMLM